MNLRSPKTWLIAACAVGAVSLAMVSVFLPAGTDSRTGLRSGPPPNSGEAAVNVVDREAPQGGTTQPQPVETTQAIEKSQRIFICGHSFHMFIEKPLEAMAREAGYGDHTCLGTAFIGGSRPLQHWNTPDRDNTAKQALRTGNVDVLTLAPNKQMPDEGIDLFSDLAFEQNPHGRVLLQLSWSPYDGSLDPGNFKNPDHDKATPDTLKTLHQAGETYLDAMRAQAGAINRRHNTTFVYIVPAGKAVLKLRELIIAAQVPGIHLQSELFTDGLGHPSQPLKNLVSFCWFSAIYRRSPVGLTALDKPGDENSKKLNRLLQRLAWEAVTEEPMSGVSP